MQRASLLVGHAKMTAIPVLQALETQCSAFEDVGQRELEPSWIAVFGIGVVGVAYAQLADSVPSEFHEEICGIVYQDLEAWHPRLREELLSFFLQVIESEMEGEKSLDLILGEWFWQIIGHNASQRLRTIAQDVEWQMRIGNVMVATAAQYWESTRAG